MGTAAISTAATACKTLDFITPAFIVGNLHVSLLHRSSVSCSPVITLKDSQRYAQRTHARAVAAVPCTLWKNRYGVMKLLKRISSLPFIMYSVAVLLSWQMYSKTSMSALQRRSNPPLHGLV